MNKSILVITAAAALLTAACGNDKSSATSSDKDKADSTAVGQKEAVYV